LTEPLKLVVEPTSSELPLNQEIHKVSAIRDNIKGNVVYEIKLKGRKIRADPQYGLLNYEVKDGTLKLCLKPVTYYEALVDWKLGQMPEIKEKVERISSKYLDNPYALFGRVLAVNTSIRLSDGSYLLTYRDPETFDYWLSFHNVGGHPKEKDKAPDGFVYDWVEVMKTQIENELGIERELISDVKLLGLAHNVHTYKPDLLFESYVNITPEELIRRKGIESERFETLGLVN